MVDTLSPSRPAGSQQAAGNPLALAVARQILDGAHDFSFSFDEKEVRVEAERMPPPPWPAAGLTGLSPEAHGPWPASVRLRCSWVTGSTTLLLEVSYWGSNDAYRDLVSLRAWSPAGRRELLWITLALPLDPTRGVDEAVITATFVPSRRRDEEAEPAIARAAAARGVLARSGLPLASSAQVEVCRVRMADGRVSPAAGEVFERLARLTVLKMPFFLRETEGVEGALLFESPREAQAAPTLREAEPNPEGKRAGLWPLPGGVRQYKQTLDALLEEIEPEPMPVQTLAVLLRERYEVTGETTRKGYTGVLTHLGLCTVSEGRIALTPAGQEYLQSRDPVQLFERLNASFTGILEVLVIARVVGAVDSDRVREALKGLLDVRWETNFQVNYRRNWLLSLGLTARSAAGDSLTELGARVLETHAEEAAGIRERLEQLLDELGPALPAEGEEELISGDTAATAPGLDDEKPAPRVEPSAWSADRVDLEAAMVAPFARDLELPGGAVERAVAALSAGKHLLLVGPPGTGKTELAHALVEAASAEGYCSGAFVATASADWTTFDTIGGYALQRDGSLCFRSGALLRAIEQWQWLVIDELNRADVDRAFGELMTVLAGRTTDTAYQLDDGRTVRIGPDPRASHPMPRTFRVLATMNTWDKTSLFRLSYAVQRRFAIVTVGLPDDGALATLLRRHATQQGPDAPLEAAAASALVELFSTRSLLGVRPIGPAVALDVIRYMRRRAAGASTLQGDALAEALALLLLPQLEGLDHDGAVRAFEAMDAALAGWTSAEGREELRQRFAEVFPQVALP